MNRTRTALAGFAIFLAASQLWAAPAVSVVATGINPSGNREWSVRVWPDAALFYNPDDFPDRGVGGSVAVELAISVGGSAVSDVDVHSAVWAYANPGHNPFTGSITTGLAFEGGASSANDASGGAGAPSLLGDYNDNGIVGLEDFPVWQDSLGAIEFLAADGNADGVVDSIDYELWAANYGGIAAGGSDPTNTMFAAFGSQFLMSFGPVELLKIETLGSGPTTITWGNLAGAPHTGGNRLAQIGVNFDGSSGSVTVPEPASVALALLIGLVGALKSGRLRSRRLSLA